MKNNDGNNAKGGFSRLVPLLKAALLAAALLAVPASAFDAKAHPFGGGFFLGGGITHGANVGLHGRYLIDSRQMAEAALTWNFGETWGGVNCEGDYIFRQWPDLIQMDKGTGKMPLYIGVGGWAGFWRHHWRSASGRRHREHDLSLGGGMPLGISFFADGAPFDAFLELTPGLQLIPSCVFTLELMLGAHYYF